MHVLRRRYVEHLGITSTVWGCHLTARVPPRPRPVSRRVTSCRVVFRRPRSLLVGRLRVHLAGRRLQRGGATLAPRLGPLGRVAAVAAVVARPPRVPFGRRRRQRRRGEVRRAGGRGASVGRRVVFLVRTRTIAARKRRIRCVQGRRLYHYAERKYSKV